MIYPKIDPVFLQLGPLSFRWYGLAYVVGYLLVFYLGRIRLSKKPTLPFQEPIWSDILFYMMLGGVVGGRIGYMVIYQTYDLWLHPLHLFYVWQGGMSFHGGLVGALLGAYLITRSKKISLLSVLDFVVPFVPIGLGLGRLANFVNGELWGRPTHQSWGMIFPHVDMQLRHPSQLYECLGEGVLLACILNVLSNQEHGEGIMCCYFLFFYGIIRFVLEFFRAPDYQLGLLYAHLSMGQYLCIPMLVIGAYGLYFLSPSKHQA